MNYQELIVKELRGMMRDRSIPRRSQFTRKQDIIDRLIQADQEAASLTSAGEEVASDQGAASFTGSPPAVPRLAVPASAPEPSDRPNEGPQQPSPGKLVPFQQPTAPEETSDQSVTQKEFSYRNRGSQKIISFRRTEDRLLLGGKTVTRRTWTDRTILSWQKAWDENRYCHKAYDKLPHHGGRQIGEIWLAQRPYLEKLADMPDADVAAEGYRELSREEFIDHFFPGDSDRTVAVIRFIFVPFPKSPDIEDFNQNADSFQVTPAQIKSKLNSLVEKELQRSGGGEFVLFLHSPSEFTDNVSRAIASHLSVHPYFEYVGKTGGTLSDQPLANFYGWRLYPNRIEYGHPSCKFLWVAREKQITKQSQFYQEFQAVLKNLLTQNIGSRYFGPILNPAEMSQMDWRKSPWLFGNLNGYWLVREEPDLSQIQVFRWWWTDSAGWRLDFYRVMVRPDGEMRCACQQVGCRHLKVIRLHRQREYLREQETRACQKDFERNQEIFRIEKERTELVEWLENNHFKEAAAQGHKLFRQPFWGLSLDCLKQIRDQLKSEVPP